MPDNMTGGPVAGTEFDETEVAQEPTSVEGQFADGEPAHEEPTPHPDSEDLRSEMQKMEQRYRSLAGVLRSKDEQIQQMQRLLEELGRQQKAQAAEPEAPLVTDSDRTVVGDEVAAFVQRVVDTAVKRAVANIETRLQGLEEGVGVAQQTAGVSAQHAFFDRLGKLVPEWETLNIDPTFMSWLEASPSRKAKFDAAASQFDADEVAVYFNAYKAEAGLASPAEKPKPKKRAQGNRAAPPAQNRPQSDKKTWTRQEILDFYARGRQLYDAKEYSRLERDIFDAQREGRVEL